MRGKERKLVTYVYLLNNIIKFLRFGSIGIERYYYPWLRKCMITNPKSLENIKEKQRGWKCFRVFWSYMERWA